MLTDRPAALNTNHTTASGGSELLAVSGQSFPKGKIRLRLKYPRINKEICIYEEAGTAVGVWGCIPMILQWAGQWVLLPVEASVPMYTDFCR